MNYSEIVVLLGNKCTAECEMCCLDANIHCDKELELNRIKEFVLSAKELDNIRIFNFSGGEAFLYYDTLLELVKCCKSINKYSTVITNGFWAKDYNTTYEKIKTLKESGLDSLGVSYDQFHEKYISVKNIKNILKASKILGIPISIQSVIVSELNNNEWVNKIGSDLVDVSINFIGCDPVGRASRFLDNNCYIRETVSRGCICRKSGTLCVSYDGRIWPCCAPFVFTTDISVGNIYNNVRTVSDALNKLEDNLILKVLRNKGFDFFIDIMNEKNLMRIPNKVISSCEICSMLFKKDMIKEMYPYVTEKLFSDINCRRRV